MDPRAFQSVSFPPEPFCKTNNTLKSCVWAAQPSTLYQVATDTAAYWNNQIGTAGTRTCTQSTDSRCTSSALSALFSNYHQIKAAWCNDNYLVVVTNLMPFVPSNKATPNLQDVLNPPGGTSSDGAPCVTRTWWGAFRTYSFLLNPTPLSNSTASNNALYYTSNGLTNYLTNTISSPNVIYYLPADGAVGMSIWGQDVFPVFNNRGTYTPEACEVDSCNQHVGQGGGAPHLHADPFGTYCGYSSANYTTTASHPPIIGISYDGYWCGQELGKSGSCVIRYSWPAASPVRPVWEGTAGRCGSFYRGRLSSPLSPRGAGSTGATCPSRPPATRPPSTPAAATRTPPPMPPRPASRPVSAGGPSPSLRAAGAERIGVFLAGSIPGVKTFLESAHSPTCLPRTGPQITTTRPSSMP